jgi:hypothetical protein
VTRLQFAMALGWVWLVGFQAAQLLEEPQPVPSPAPPPPQPRCPTPSEIAPFLHSLSSDLVLLDCDADPCMGGAWFPDEAAALAMSEAVKARYPAAWSRYWPAADGGTLLSFVVTSQELGEELQSLTGPTSTAVALWYAD